MHVSLCYQLIIVFPSLSQPLFLSLFFLSLSLSLRCDYQHTCELLISLFDTTARSYHDLLQMTTRNTEELTIREGILQLYCTVLNSTALYYTLLYFTALNSTALYYTLLYCTVLYYIIAVCIIVLLLCVGQLAWLVHMIGHVMGVRISHTNSTEYDTMDGQLVCR